MGARALEVRLRRRILAFVTPVIVGVALSAVVVTSRALDAADDEQARAIAAGAVRTARAELAEGDSVAEALGEAASTFAAARAAVHLQLGDAIAGSAPERIARLAPGACATVDEASDRWRGCAVRDGDLLVAVAVHAEAHRAVVRTLMASMLAAAVLALIAATIAARVALRRPTAALGALVAWAERVARGDERAPPPRDENTAEIDRLTRAIGGLVRDLVDALARERAYSAHVAHELRTPLTAIVAELAAMPSSGDDAVARLRSDATRLARVIDALLLLSTPRDARLRDTVVNLADVARRLAPEGAIVDAPDEALVDAEPHLVELALQNLIDNASKYARGGARVVRVAREAARVRVAVVDEGAGVAADARARMFDRYWREGADGEGSGLGLALVRAVAERHGGVADAREGGGGRGLDVGFSIGPVLAWHDEPAAR